MLGYGHHGSKVSSLILWWWWWVAEVLIFNLSNVRVIMVSFGLVTISKVIGYFIWIGCDLERSCFFVFVSFKAKYYLITPDFQAVFQITEPNCFQPSHDDWQLFIKINVCAHLLEMSRMQCCFLNLFIEIPPQRWKLLKVFGLFTVRTVVSNHNDSNLLITEKFPISAKH